MYGNSTLNIDIGVLITQTRPSCSTKCCISKHNSIYITQHVNPFNPGISRILCKSHIYTHKDIPWSWFAILNFFVYFSNAVKVYAWKDHFSLALFIKLPCNHFIFRYSLFIIYLFILPFLNVFQSVFFFSPSILHFSLSSIWFGVDRCLDVIYWRVCHVNIVRAQSIPNQSQKYFYYDKIEIRVDRDIRLMYGTLSMVSCLKKNLYVFRISHRHRNICTNHPKNVFDDIIDKISEKDFLHKTGKCHHKKRKKK